MVEETVPRLSSDRQMVEVVVLTDRGAIDRQIEVGYCQNGTMRN